MKKALLLCMDKYPNGDAGAVRTHVFAKLLRRIGYEPTVAGMGPSTDFAFQSADGVSYISLRAPSSNKVARAVNLLRFHARLQRYLLDDRDWDVIVFSEVSKKTLCVLKRYAAKKNIPLLHDSVEWYSPEQFNIGKWHPVYRAKDRMNRRWIDRSVRVIAISSYLENHFASRGIAVTRIPVIMDTENTACGKRVDPEKIVFAYAGAPGKKDYLNTVIAGFAALAKATDAAFELRVIGIVKEQLFTMCGASPDDVQALGDRLCCLGRVSRDEVIRQLSQADFTVLIRSEEQRYAKAGFPTKFVESLATATPVIANATSDLGDYLKDGENGFLVEACSAQALAQTLEKAVTLSFEERSAMHTNARKTAVERFDYTVFSEQLDRFASKD